MKYLIILSSLTFLLIASRCQPSNANEKIVTTSLSTNQEIKNLYNKLGLKRKLKFHIFKKAIYGQRQFRFRKKHILSIVDFTKPAYQKRLFIIDLAKQKLVFYTYVAHGRNSGNRTYATKFSNRNGSKMVSIQPNTHLISELFYSI